MEPRPPFTRRQSRLLIIGGVLAVALLAALGLILASHLGGKTSNKITLAANPATNLPTSGKVLGNPQSAVKVVEWGNYLCPHCADFSRNSEPQLITDYVADGRASLEFRVVAVGGKEAEDAARASYCAQDQGAFWVYHDTLFANQTGKAGQFSAARLKTIAADLGLDTAGFDSCFDGGAHATDVSQLLDASKQSGINELPTFFVNGQKVTYTGYASVKAAIDAALAQH
ncbi:MAG TPA: thioredoxin domain-containing protein [Thermomicrobiaceae bacterium]|nr:thioredoxin domain-containing protein [Thermomicrobiaceae bacterium]